MSGNSVRSAPEVLRDLIAGNHGFMGTHDAGYFNGFRDSQNPEITLVTCADSRVQADIFGGDATNRIFIIRDIGNQIIPVFGSVDYGVIHLHTPVLLVLGHTHCGALKTILGDYEDEPFDIIRELDHLSIPVRHLKHVKEEVEEIWLEAVENNIDYQIKLAVKKYKRYIDSGRLTVIGAVDDFIDAYHKGHGRVIVLNVNGETNPDKIKDTKALSLLDPAIRDASVVRNQALWE